MRSWTFDQFEFQDPQSEERLEVAYALRSKFPFPNVASFVAAVVGEQAARSLTEVSPFNERLGIGKVREHLNRFTGLQIPTPCDWPTNVLSDEWNECNIVLSSPDGYIHYCWSTSA